MPSMPTSHEFHKMFNDARNYVYKGWYQGGFAGDAEGKRLKNVYEDGAVLFSMAGAMHKAIKDSGHGLMQFVDAASYVRDALEALFPVWVNKDLGQFNDAEERTKDQVLAVFDHVIHNLS